MTIGITFISIGRTFSFFDVHEFYRNLSKCCKSTLKPQLFFCKSLESRGHSMKSRCLSALTSTSTASAPKPGSWAPAWRTELGTPGSIRTRTSAEATRPKRESLAKQMSFVLSENLVYHPPLLVQSMWPKQKWTQWAAFTLQHWTAGKAPSLWFKQLKTYGQAGEWQKGIIA